MDLESISMKMIHNADIKYVFFHLGMVGERREKWRWSVKNEKWMSLRGKV